MTFLAVAETKSFRLAAERLRVSPPAVSARIRELEDRLGVRLFHRTTRSVVPTAEGERLGAAALQALEQLHGASDALRDEAALRHGRFSVATLPSMAATILPPAMAEFRGDHPGVEIGMIDAPEGRALEAVVSVDMRLCLGKWKLGIESARRLPLQSAGENRDQATAVPF